MKWKSVWVCNIQNGFYLGGEQIRPLSTFSPEQILKFWILQLQDKSQVLNTGSSWLMTGHLVIEVMTDFPRATYDLVSKLHTHTHSEVLCPHFGWLATGLHLQPFAGSHGHMTMIFSIFCQFLFFYFLAKTQIGYSRLI